MGVIPNINKSSDEAQDAFAPLTQEQSTQLVGCYLCLMDGNVEQPSVIYHYTGTTYCIDHLYPILAKAQQ